MYLPQKMKRKGNSRHIGYQPIPLHNSESVGADHRKTFYSNKNSNSIVNKTTSSHENYLENHKSHVHNTFGPRMCKFQV